MTEKIKIYGTQLDIEVNYGSKSLKGYFVMSYVPVQLCHFFLVILGSTL